MGCRFLSFPSYSLKYIPIAYASIVNVILNWKNIDFYELLIYCDEMETYTIENYPYLTHFIIF
jgi:hypothetical protein